ncbi:hypothetical protein FVEN_g3879 [Fusarium venenatum]|nr:hypothetical protein FVEN_g3879 [Fusarium venenatum]
MQRHLLEYNPNDTNLGLYGELAIAVRMSFKTLHNSNDTLATYVRVVDRQNTHKQDQDDDLLVCDTDYPKIGRESDIRITTFNKLMEKSEFRDTCIFWSTWCLRGSCGRLSESNGIPITTYLIHIPRQLHLQCFANRFRHNGRLRHPISIGLSGVSTLNL